MPIVSVQNFINRRNAQRGHGGQPMADKGSMFDVLHHTCQVCLNHQENNRIDEDVFRNCLLETLRDNHIFSPNTDDYSQLSNSDQNYIKEPINMLLFWNAIRKENNQYLILRHALLEQFALSLRDALAMTFLLNQQLWNLIIEFTPTPQDLEDLPEYALWPRPPHIAPFSVQQYEAIHAALLHLEGPIRKKYQKNGRFNQDLSQHIKHLWNVFILVNKGDSFLNRSLEIFETPIPDTDFKSRILKYATQCSAGIINDPDISLDEYDLDVDDVRARIQELANEWS